MTREFLSNFKELPETAIQAILEENQRDVAAANTHPGENGAAGGKTFTQEEVNKIVSERLAKERQKATQQTPEDERERDLKAREARLACRDYLDEKGLPKSLLDALDASDVDAFTGTVERLLGAFPNAFTPAPPPPPYAAGTGTGRVFDAAVDDAVAGAFKPPKI